MELHLFDFDGTISTTDSFVEYMRFTRGPFVLYLGILIYGPLLILMRLGLADREKTKEKILAFYLKGKSKAWLDEQSQKFFETKMQKIIRPQAVTEIKRLKAAGHEVSVVSASVDIWLSPFCKKYDLNLICTKANFVNAIFNGKFASPNCRKEEKVNRIKAIYNLADYTKVVAYGDTEGDYEMFEMADEHFYRPFRGEA